MSNGSGEASNLPQRLLIMDKQLWQDVKHHMVEYSLDHVSECKQCSICLMDFNIRQKDENICGDSVVQLPCNKQHIFHTDCLKEWVTTQFTCPICRDILIMDK